MTRLDQLPERLITEIFEYILPADDPLPLLSICKRLRAVAEKIIYLNIELDYKHVPDPCRRLHLLLRTLLARRDLAERVRFLSIECVQDLVGLSSDAKEPERQFLRSLGLDDEETWLGALDSDVTDLYAAVIVLLTPHLVDLTLKIRDGFYFISQAVDPAFHTPGTGTRTLWSLQRLTYGSGLSNTDTKVVEEAYHVRDLPQLFYLPSLTSLSLTGVGGGQFTWPTGHTPRKRTLLHLSISGPWFNVGLLDEILAACPCLESVSCLVDDRGNSSLDVYGNFGRALARVQSTIKEITIRYYNVYQARFLEPDPDPAILETAVVHRRDHVQPIGSLAQFTQLERLVLPVVAYLGGNPEEVPNLRAILPSTLEKLDIMDDTWIVMDNVAQYWSLMFDHLIDIIRQKQNDGSSLQELSIWVEHSSEEKFDFRAPYGELKALGENAGVRVSFWMPYEP